MGGGGVPSRGVPVRKPRDGTHPRATRRPRDRTPVLPGPLALVECCKTWRQIWRVAGRESGSPELQKRVVETVVLGNAGNFQLIHSPNIFLVGNPFDNSGTGSTSQLKWLKQGDEKYLPPPPREEENNIFRWKHWLQPPLW